MSFGMGPAPIQGFPPSPSTGTDISSQSLATTALTPVLAYTPAATQALSVLVGFEVTTSTTAVTCYVTWTGADGKAHTMFLTGKDSLGNPAAWSLPPEDYSFPQFTLTAQGGSTVIVYAQASVASQVAVSGAVWQEV